MYELNTGNNTIELKARAASYRRLKLIIGADNLKTAFMNAYSNMDIEFLGKVIEIFCADEAKLRELGGADGVIDECIDNGVSFEKVYADVAAFLNGMGFFGDLNLAKKETAIDWFKNPMNGINLDEKLAKALNNGLDEVVKTMVQERFKD